MFNDDIRQLSQKLTHVFIGYCHEYVVQLLWKLLSKK